MVVYGMVEGRLIASCLSPTTDSAGIMYSVALQPTHHGLHHLSKTVGLPILILGCNNNLDLFMSTVNDNMFKQLVVTLFTWSTALSDVVSSLGPERMLDG